MRGNNPLNQSKTPEFEKNTLPERSNPLVDINNITNQHKRYKSVRVHPDDFEYLKRYGFLNDMAIIDVISLAVNILKERDSEALQQQFKLLENKMTQ